MAKIPEFQTKVDPTAPRAARGGDGSAELFAQIADTATRFADGIGKMADKAAEQEGRQAGLAAASKAAMPTIDYAISDGGSSSFLDKTMQVESGGNPNARNPNSSATGHFQFIDSTWLDVFKRRRPDLAAGKSDADILALRNDPAVSREMAGAYASENGSYLKSRGIHVNDTTLYLAHFLGAGGAADLLGGGDMSASVDGILKPGQIAANPTVLKGKTVGDVVAWASGKMGGEAGGSGVSATVNGKIGPLDLSGAMTIRGQAFDGAALDVYAQRADMSLRNGMAALAINDELAANPARLASSLDAFVAGQLENAPDIVKPSLMVSAERQKLALVNDASTAYRKKAAADAAAVFQDGLAARETDLARMAASLPMDDAGNAALAGELDEYDAFIASSPLDPVDKGRLRRDMRTDIMGARVMAQFAAQPDAASRKRFSESFADAWTKGEAEAAGIDAQGYNRISGQMAAQLGRDETEMTRQTAALDKQITGMFERLGNGFAVPQGDLIKLKSQSMMIGDPLVAERASMLIRLNSWQSANRMATPQEIGAQIDALNGTMMEVGASEAGLQALGVMEGLKTQMEKELVRDPNGWAVKAGVTDLTPLDFSSAATTVASVSARWAEAQSVSARYGTEAKLFRPDEAARLQFLGSTDPAFIPSFAAGIVEALGPEAPRVLAQISDKAPLVAHVAGLVQGGSRTDLLLEVGQVIGMRNAEGYKAALPKPSDMTAVAGSTLAGALSALPGTQVAALEMAGALYEGRAFTRGLPPDGFEKPDSPGARLYRQAIEESLGAEFIDGKKYGGIATVNGSATLAPPGVLAERLQSALSSISADDLAGQAPMGTANGLPLTVEQLRGARLVVVGNGRYRVSVNDPASFAPEYVMGADGGFWELDLPALLKSQDARGAAALPDELVVRGVSPFGMPYDFQVALP